MFNNLFRKNANKGIKKVHCEITGAETDIRNISGLIRINGVIALKNLRNPTIDHNKKLIHSDGKPSLKFYSEIFIPERIKNMFGSLYSIIDDVDEIEKSYAIISEEGKIIFAAQSLGLFDEHIKKGAELIKLPDHLFLSVIDTTPSFKTKKCEIWDWEFKATGNKYRYKKLLEERSISVNFGYPMMLLPGFNTGVSDISNKNPKGTSYQFKTEQSYQKIDLCSNESAVDYCKKNNAIIFYNDFLNNGQLRALTSYTENINKNLKNHYLFRSSNI